MKKIIYAICPALLCLASTAFAQPIDEPEVVDPIVQQYLDIQENGESADGGQSQYVRREKIYPDPKRHKAPTQEQIQAAIDKNAEHASEDYVEENNDTFMYGVEDQICSALDTLVSEEDPRFVDAVYDLFAETKSSLVKQKVLSYFTKLKDPCLEDFAVDVINDPYDQKKPIVSACFSYLAAVKSAAAVPGVVDLLDKEEEDYFNSALSCLGDIGGEEEAVFIAEYLDRDDLTTAQRQQLMKVLGKLKAVQTYDKLVEIVQNEDEDSYVRMYAAEAIGAMQMDDAEEILADLFETEDANLRVYVIKGLANFTDKTASDIIIQALRDSQYKVRLEAITAVQQQELKTAVPYLIYRCKDKGEQQQVKDKCYTVLADFNTKEGNSYLVSLIKDKRLGDNTKAKVASALLKVGAAGTDEILELARDTLKSDIHKNLRYSLGKEFAKYGRAEYASICSEYLANKDVATQGTGLDIYAKGRYASLTAQIEQIARSGKANNANAKKARKILGMSEEEERPEGAE